jgi:hypothetical protein
LKKPKDTAKPRAPEAIPPRPVKPTPPLRLDDVDSPEHARALAEWKRRDDAWLERYGSQIEQQRATHFAKLRERAAKLPAAFVAAEPQPPREPSSYHEWEQYRRKHAAWRHMWLMMERQQALEQGLETRSVRAVIKTLLGGSALLTPSAPTQKTSFASAQGAPRLTGGRKPHPDRDAIVALHKRLLIDNSQQTLKATVAEVNKQVAKGFLKRGVSAKTLGEWLHQDETERK